MARKFLDQNQRLLTSKDVAVLAERLTVARAQTDALFELIRPDAVYDRPIPERHRLIFYFGHLEAFDWNQICRNALDVASFHPEFDKLFEFGIDPEPGTAAQDQPADWPRTSEVRAYNTRVRSKVDSLLSEAPEQIVNVAIEHRLMHAETFAYLMHEMPYERKLAAGTVSSNGGAAPAPNDLIDIPAGCATLGQTPDRFGWDNEFVCHRRTVDAFRISKYKITNGEYLEFVRAGAQTPHFWTKSGDGREYRGMFGTVPLPLDHPVYVTHDEARAYAEWVGMGLPSEAQFHRAAYGTADGAERTYPWGGDAPRPSHGNFDFAAWDPVSVTATPAGDSAFGVSQLTGNGWEWTSTEFSPFPGFREFSFYPGYSKNFFDGRHFVMKGGSPRTASALLRRSFRNWFRPNYPYVYATFRLVDNG
jgi:iron(II)-dependent oxidoreductase